MASNIHGKILIVEDGTTLAEGMATLLLQLSESGRLNVKIIGDLVSAEYEQRTNPHRLVSWDLSLPLSSQSVSILEIEPTVKRILLERNPSHHRLIYTGRPESSGAQRLGTAASLYRSPVFAKGASDDLAEFPFRITPETWACFATYLLEGPTAKLQRDRRWKVLQNLLYQLESLIGPIRCGLPGLASIMATSLPRSLAALLESCAKHLDAASEEEALALHFNKLRMELLVLVQAQTAIWTKAGGTPFKPDSSIPAGPEKSIAKIAGSINDSLQRAEASRVRFPGWPNFVGGFPTNPDKLGLMEAADQVRLHRNRLAHKSNVFEQRPLLPLTDLFGVFLDALAYWVDYPFLTDLRKDSGVWTAKSLASLAQSDAARIPLPSSLKLDADKTPSKTDVVQVIWGRPTAANLIENEFELVPELVSCSPWIRLKTTGKPGQESAEILWHALSEPEAGSQEWRTLGFDGSIDSCWINVSEL